MRCRYIPGGIAQEALFIQVFNIILPNFFALLNPPHPLFSGVLSHRARTQDAADALMDPPPFLLPLRVANTVRTVALTVLYMPVLPASTVLGLIGSIVSCAPPPPVVLSLICVASCPAFVRERGRQAWACARERDPLAAGAACGPGHRELSVSPQQTACQGPHFHSGVPTLHLCTLSRPA